MKKFHRRQCVYEPKTNLNFKEIQLDIPVSGSPCLHLKLSYIERDRSQLVAEQSELL